MCFKKFSFHPNIPPWVFVGSTPSLFMSLLMMGDVLRIHFPFQAHYVWGLFWARLFFSPTSFLELQSNPWVCPCSYWVSLLLTCSTGVFESLTAFNLSPVAPFHLIAPSLDFEVAQDEDAESYRSPVLCDPRRDYLLVLRLVFTLLLQLSPLPDRRR